MSDPIVQAVGNFIYKFVEGRTVLGEPVYIQDMREWRRPRQGNVRGFEWICCGSRTPKVIARIFAWADGEIWVENKLANTLKARSNKVVLDVFDPSSFEILRDVLEAIMNNKWAHNYKRFKHLMRA